IASSQVSARLAAGNLDYDVAEELVLVVNEVLGSTTATGAASYVVFDDANAGLPAVNDGAITAQAGGLKALQVADVDIGDVTGSGVGQVVFAGMTALDDGCDSPEGVAAVFEDALGGFAQVAAETFNVFVSNCPANAPWKVRFLHVNAFDIDGDGIDELQAWRNVYQDFSEAAPFTLIGELPEGQFLEVGPANGAYITANTAQIVSGDLTGDGREDLVLYHQWFEDASVWGLSQIETVGFAQLSAVPIATTYNTQTEVRPLLVPVNLDVDGPVLKYDLASHELVFTEPIVIAGGSLGIEYETSVDVTAGPALAGFSVGYGVSASLTFASGSSTTYEVSVGDLTPASYEANAYSFGMFTYVQELEGAEFDVINFWVE
ncbi:MAG TPA: hypothetical protein VFD39_10355, partial [Trueperaceae bacterium]|nr:hypothetical protein [Trueperaceae bacterium]